MAPDEGRHRLAVVDKNRRAQEREDLVRERRHRAAEVGRVAKRPLAVWQLSEDTRSSRFDCSASRCSAERKRVSLINSSLLRAGAAARSV